MNNLRFEIECEYSGPFLSGKIHFQTDNDSIREILFELAKTIRRQFYNWKYIKIKTFTISFEEWKIWHDENDFPFKDLMDFILRSDALSPKEKK